MARYTPPGSLNSILAINAELEKISEAFEDTVSRKNDSPNQMEGDLDLNGNSLLNVQSDPNNPDSLVTRGEVYTEDEVDSLLATNLQDSKDYTDVREANIRADFSEGITGATVVVYPTVGALEGSEPTQTGQRAEVVETGGQYITAEVSYTPIPGDYTAGNGRIWKLVGGHVTTALTVNIPSDYPTMQEAIDFYHNKVFFADNSELVINIESGHQPASGVSVSNGDYSYIRIASDDVEVALAPGFIGAGEGSVIDAYNARGVTLDCLIDINGEEAFNGYNVTDNSTAIVTAGSGMKNGTRGMHVQNSSSCVMDGAVFTGFQQAGLHVSRASKAQCTEAVLSGNSQDSANSFGAVYASRNSEIHGANVDVTGSGGGAIRAQRFAKLALPGVNVSNCGGAAMIATLGGSIYSSSDSPVMQNIGGQGIVAQDGGVVSIDSATLTFTSGMSDAAVESRSSQIVMRNSDISGHDGIGVFAKGVGANIEMTSTSITGGSNGVRADEGAVVNAANSNITGGSGNGVIATEGSKIIVTNATLTGFSNDLACVTGSTVCANGCTTTNSTGAPDAADTNFSNFNAIESDKGIIWA